MRKLLIVLFSTMIFLTGCDTETEEPQVETEVTEPAVQPEPEPEVPEEPEELEEPVIDLETMDINPLTGLYVDKEIAYSRPIAVSINNLHKALPQSGISQADIIYEVLAEGEITRMVAIFSDVDSDKIGPVRSNREYFTDFALDNDAIYFHHGSSPNGYDAIYARDIDNIDGITNTTAFFRDKERSSISGMYEHSSYITSEGAYKSIENYGYDTERSYDATYKFEEAEPLETPVVSKITIPYSSYQVSSFEYDDGLYYRYQSGDAHIDEETGETLSFNNVLVQFASTKVIDSVGRRSVGLVGSGDGILYKNGDVFDVTWEKSSHSSPTKWYVDGEDMVLTEGKTFICVVPIGQTIEQ